jgi:hypothetical protein
LAKRREVGIKRRSIVIRFAVFGMSYSYEYQSLATSKKYRQGGEI